MRKKIVILITTLVFISQSVNANELNKFNQKFNNFFELLIDKIQNEVEKTKEYQKKVWSESKLIKTKKD